MLSTRSLALTALALLVAGCRDSALPTALLAGVAASAGDGTLPNVVVLCKAGPQGTSATFSVAATGGELRAGPVVTVAANPLDDNSGCVEIWRAMVRDEISTVTVRETSATPGTELKHIVTLSALDGWGEPDVGGATASVRADWNNDAIIWFKNVAVPIADPGYAGCTPGFWKQTQHFAYWTAPLAPSTPFGVVFADAFPGMTLLQVASNGGGGLNALGRHTVAALLNAASAEVAYGPTAEQVIASFNAAYASGDYDTQKNLFEELNERGCTVDKSAGSVITAPTVGPPAGKGEKK